MITAGTLVDERYELIGLIGEGGYGAVYKARQRQLDRVVAIKTLSTTLLHAADGAARFEREAKLINSLKHKNIVVFYGYGVWEQAPYFVMEYVNGRSLQSMMAGRDSQAAGSPQPLPELRSQDARTILDIMTQVFEALGAAHAAGVVHRDLKPANILVDENGNVKIIDFGLAKLMPGYGVLGQKLTETGYTVGTCHYMAPEQALGMPVDQRSDIYSAGCIMYQMLSGQVPFDGNDNVAVMLQHIEREPKPLSDSLDKTPESKALATFVANCMAKDPTQRYQSCEEVLTSLQQIRTKRYRDVVSHVVPARSRCPRQSRKPSSLLKAVAAFAIIITSITAAVYCTQQANQYRSFGSAAQYESGVRNKRLKFNELLAIVHQDMTDHQLAQNQRLDAVYEMLCMAGSEDFFDIDRWIEYLFKVRGDLVVEKTPPRDCRVYTDGDFARALVGWNWQRYERQCNLLIDVAKRQSFGSENAVHAQALLAFRHRKYDTAQRLIADEIHSRDRYPYELGRYIAENQIQEALAFEEQLRPIHEDNNLDYARIYFRAGKFEQSLACALKEYNGTPDFKQKALAARYVLAAAAMAHVSLPNLELLKACGRSLPAIEMGYPIQEYDREVWRWYTGAP